MLENLCFGVRVNGRQRVVQNEYARAAYECARECRALLLTTRERDAAFADFSLILLGKLLFDVLRQTRFERRALNLFRACLLIAECDVCSNRFAEEKRLLRNEADRSAKLLEWDSLNRTTVNADL